MKMGPDQYIHVIDILMTATKRNQLFRAAQEFCSAFAAKRDIDFVLDLFSKTHERTVIEHGEPSLAPFLGRRFVGPSVRKYFEVVNDLLDYDSESMHFPEYIVDVEKNKVFVRGKGKFTWRSTGESWDETFAYALDFDDEFKVTDYQVWADSGAAYLARVGKLDETRKVRE
jgi:hypothetical protein